MSANRDILCFCLFLNIRSCILNFVHCNGESLVLIIARIAGLSCLSCLRLFDELRDALVLEALLIAMLILVRASCDWKPERYLHIGVTSQRGQERRVCPIEVGVVDGTPETSKRALLSGRWHVHGLCQPVAYEELVRRQLFISRKSCCEEERLQRASDLIFLWALLAISLNYSRSC